MIGTAWLAMAVALFLCALQPAGAQRRLSPWAIASLKKKSAEASLGRSAKPPFDVRWFSGQEVDHFGYTEAGTFSQRYLVNSSFWGSNKEGIYWSKKSASSCPGPILFYTGNEGDITLFWENTGFVTEYLAPKLGALVVFAEHRYYGETLPFGSQSFTHENMRYLTTEQALADYAKFMTWFKAQTPGAENCPVVSFGGSYGGMLSAWFRVKYPWVVDGAVSASAPILEFAGVPGYSQWSFNEIITQDFAQTQFGGDRCAETLRQGMRDVITMGKTSAGRQQLEEIFRPCGGLKSAGDVDALYAWLDNGFAYEAMADYPYPANFLEPMPGYPINISCSKAMGVNPPSAVRSVMAAISVYYNSTGTAGQCMNLSIYSTGALGMTSWDYQACTEMDFPISSNGTSDMFLPSYFDEAAYAAGCKQQFGVTPRPEWMPLQFGAAQLQSGVSNIVFSNGMLDPWRSGGVVKSLSDSVVAVVIEGGAHHLDMRTPNPLDPESVVVARKIEEAHILKWCSPKMGRPSMS